MCIVEQASESSGNWLYFPGNPSHTNKIVELKRFALCIKFEVEILSVVEALSWFILSG